jgi:hypothetical protein
MDYTFGEGTYTSNHNSMTASQVSVRVPVKTYSKDDVPAGVGPNVVSMPLPVIADPKSGLTDIEIKQKQVSNMVAEEKDLSGITYGTAAKPYKVQVMTPEPMGGQRTLPSAYGEKDPKISSAEDLINLIVDNNINIEQLKMGIAEEQEHTTNKTEATSIAITHLLEKPDYYTRLKKAMDHAEFPILASELKEVPAMGIGIANDRNLTDLPPKDIHQDARGELMMKRDEPVYSEDDDDEVEDGFEDEDGMWVSAFKAGMQTDSEGVSRKWEPGDMGKIAQQYNKSVDKSNPGRHVAPVVIGHPEHNSPAWGWIDRAKAVGQKLYLHLSELQPEFVDLLKRGMYKTRSISLYPDLNIRHIGFLGGAVPAVKGLGPFKFDASAEKFSTYNFEEVEMSDLENLRKENHFFKKLFKMFKMDTSEHKESAIQSTVTNTVNTTTGETPEGATMAEEKKPVETTELGSISHSGHLKYAKSYLDKFCSHVDAKSSAEDMCEFASLAMHHLDSASIGSGKAMPEHMKSAKEALVAGEMDKAKNHLNACHAELEATIAGNFKEEIVDHSETVKEGVVPAEGTKEVPVTAIKDDKDALTKVQEELSKLKDENSLLKSENEKLKSAAVEEQKENALGQYKEFCQGLVSEGRMRPVDVDQAVLNLKSRATLQEVETQCYTEGKSKVAPTDYVAEYKNYLSAQPKTLEDLTKEIIVGAAPKQAPADDFVEAKITEAMKANANLQYHEALTIVSREFPDKVQAYVESSMGR